MTARRYFAILLPFAALMIAAGCGHDEPSINSQTPDPITVQTVGVQLDRDSKPIEVRGVVKPARQADVSTRVMGPVVALRVKSGSTVAKGQTLLEIQPEASQGQLSQAEGALGQAQAGLALAERNYERFRALHADNAASELELDMARMQYEQATAAVEQAQGAVTSAFTVAGESAVRAPFAARVINTLIEVGDLASPGRPLVRIESLGGQQIWLTVREADAGRVALGDELAIEFDARPDLGSVTGTVEEIVPSVDPATHTLTVKVGLGSLNIPTGFSGRAQIDGDPVDRLTIPAVAVHRRGGLELVVVRTADGTARTRAVTTGSTHGEDIEILSGLDAGDSVVIDAPGPVTDGTPLEVVR
ncbi:MAG: efflux RND transporter periplasmic adaptor subunit [Holophagae bacterium]|jgi:RND family efflux transporter MFP subunit